MIMHLVPLVTFGKKEFHLKRFIPTTTTTGSERTSSISKLSEKIDTRVG